MPCPLPVHPVPRLQCDPASTDFLRRLEYLELGGSSSRPTSETDKHFVGSSALARCVSLTRAPFPYARDLFARGLEKTIGPHVTRRSCLILDTHMTGWPFRACWTVFDDYDKLWDYDFYDVKGL